MTITAERLLVLGCTLAEGPIRLRDGELAWVDILDGLIYRWDRRNSPTTVQLGEPVGAIAETTEGTLVAAAKSGLRHVLPDGAAELLIALPDRGADIRMNEGKADPWGRFVGGTMITDPPRSPAGSLWSFAGGEARELFGAVTISNGLVWTPSGDTMYYIDTPTHRIDVFDYDGTTGAVSDRRTIVEIDPDVGDPDGMCMDTEGGLWVAMWGGGAVLRFADGVLDERIDVPTPYVTCPTFVGENLDELLITSAAEPFDRDRPDGAGDLYIAVPGIAGPPAYLADLDVVTAGPAGRRVHWNES